jgi:hypothetical protein
VGRAIGQDWGMATLTSSSTTAEVKAAYDDNAGYAEDDSAGAATTFITACRILLRRLPKSVMRGSSDQLTLELELIHKEMLAAQRWLSGKRTGGGVRHPDFSNFRG